VAQVHADGVQGGRRGDAEFSEGARLEFDHLWLVHLEDRRSRRPAQAVGAGVETGSQDDGLTDAGV
jgi:hypothetical protein